MCKTYLRDSLFDITVTFTVDIILLRGLANYSAGLTELQGDGDV